MCKWQVAPQKIRCKISSVALCMVAKVYTFWWQNKVGVLIAHANTIQLPHTTLLYSMKIFNLKSMLYESGSTSPNLGLLNADTDTNWVTGALASDRWYKLASFPGSHVPERKHWNYAGVESLVVLSWLWCNQNRTRIFRTERQHFACCSITYAFNAWCVWYSPPITKDV